MTLSSNFILPIPAQSANPQVTPRDPGVRPDKDSGAGKSFADMVSDQAREGGRPSVTPNRSDSQSETSAGMDQNESEPAPIISEETNEAPVEDPAQTSTEDMSEAVAEATSANGSPAPVIFNSAEIPDDIIPAETPAPSAPDAMPDVAPVETQPNQAVEPDSKSEPFGKTVRDNTPAATGMTPPESGMTPSGQTLPEAAIKSTSEASVEEPVPAPSSQTDTVQDQTPVQTTSIPVASVDEPVVDEAKVSPALDESLDEGLETKSDTTSELKNSPSDQGRQSPEQSAPTQLPEQASDQANAAISQTPAPAGQQTPAQSVAPNPERPQPSATPAQPGEDGPATPAQPVSNPAAQVKAPEADLKGDNRKSNAYTGKPESTPAQPGQAEPSAETVDIAASASAKSASGSVQTPSDNASQTAIAAQTSRPATFVPVLVPDQAIAGDVLTETGADPDMDALLPFKANPSAQGVAEARQAANTAARMGPAHIQTVATRIAQRFNEGARVFEIRLDPPELGRVDVRLELGPDNRVSAIMTAEKADALAELQRSARDLARGLAEAGLDLSESDLSFQLGGRNADSDGENEPHRWQRSNASVFADIEGSGLSVTNPGMSYGFALKSQSALNVRI